MTFTVSAADNITKCYTSVPPYVATKHRPRGVVYYWNSFSYEFAMNFLEPIERFFVHVGFWMSLGYTLYQLYWLTFLLRDVFAAHFG